MLNKFSALTKKLLEKKLWTSEFSLIKRIEEKNGLEITFTEQEEVKLLGIVASVDKSLVDNTNILPTDISFFTSAIDCVPKKEYLVKYNSQTYKIVRIVPTGTLNNVPVCYNIVGRLA